MIKLKSSFCLAFLLTKLGRLEDAERVYWNLIERNPDNLLYYKQIEQCQNLDPSLFISFKLFLFLEVPLAKEKLVALYETIIIQRPRAPIPKLLQLQYLEGSAFEEKVRAHLIACFRKGIPSLFKNMVMLYGDQQKVEKIRIILIEFLGECD